MPGPNDNTSQPASTEDSILAGIDRAEGITSDQSQSDPPTQAEQVTQERNTTDGNRTTTTAPGGNTTQAQPTDPRTAQTNNNSQQRTEQQQQQEQPIGRLANDGKGNLVDAQGRVVIPAGPGRRIFERAVSDATKAIREDIPRLQNELRVITAERDAMKAANDAPTRLGLRHDEVVPALQLYAKFKVSPVEVTKGILTELAAAGHNLDGIIKGVDTAAIVHALKQQLQPFAQDRQAVVETQQRRDAATQEVERFYGRYPDARIHEAPLANLMAQDENLSLSEAYFRLKTYALDNGLDWNRPLREQLGQQRNANNNNGHTYVPPIGGGRSANNQQQMTETGRDFSASAPFDDIIDASLREAGYRR